MTPSLLMYATLALTTVGPIVAVLLSARRPGVPRGRTLAWAGLAGALPMVILSLVFVPLAGVGAALAIAPRLVLPGAMWGGIVGFVAIFLRGRLGATTDRR